MKKRKIWSLVTLAIATMAGAGIAFTVLATSIKTSDKFMPDKEGVPTKEKPTSSPLPNKIPTNPQNLPPLSESVPAIIVNKNGSHLSQGQNITGEIKTPTGQSNVQYTWIIRTEQQLWTSQNQTKSQIVSLNLANYAQQIPSFSKNGYVQFFVTLKVDDGANSYQTKTINIIFLDKNFPLLILPSYDGTTVGSDVWTMTPITITSSTQIPGATFIWQQNVNGNWSTIGLENDLVVNEAFPTTNEYRLVVKSGSTSMTSNTLSLNFQNQTNLRLSFNGNTPGKGEMVNLTDGSNYDLTVAATYNLLSLKDPSFQWQIMDTTTNGAWQNITGANEQFYDFVANNPGYGVSYRLIVSVGGNEITSESLNFNNPVDLGTVSFNSNLGEISGSLNTTPGQTVEINTLIKGGNLTINDPNLCFQWQIYQGNGWENYQTGPSISVSSETYQIERFRLYLYLNNNFIWSDTTSPISIVFKMPANKIQIVKDNATKYFQNNLSKLWNEWLQNNKNYIIELISGWAYGYELSINEDDLTNWNLTDGTDGYITVSAVTTKDLTWTGWSGQGETQTIPSGATITARLPWLYNGGTLDVSAAGGVTYNVQINQNAISNGTYTNNVQKNSNFTPFGYSIYVNGKIFNSQSEINFLRNSGFNDPTTIIPFHDFTNSPWSNNELQMNSDNVTMPNFLN